MLWILRMIFCKKSFTLHLERGHSHMAKLKTHGFGIILDEQSLLVPFNVSVVIYFWNALNLLVNLVPLWTYVCSSFYSSSTLLQDLLTRNRSFSITTQTKRGGGERFHQVEIGGNMVLTHCVDRAQDWTNCQSCCKFTLQNALDHVL